MSYSNLEIPQDKPVYKTRSACFLANELIGEDKLIVWEKEPNLEMIPVNELAEKKFEDFLDKIDSYAQKKAEKAGNEFRSIKQDYGYDSPAEKKSSILLTPQSQVPLFGGAKEQGVEKVDVKPKEVPISVGKRAVNRTMNGEE